MEAFVPAYLKKLLARKNLSQSQLARELFVSRQQISYLMSGKRELTVDLAIRMESFFSLKEGSLLALQAKDSVMQLKAQIKKNLMEKLLAVNAFWSYDVTQLDRLSDEDIIENVILHLDMKEIEQLFSLFGSKKVKEVWEERLACQGEHLHNLNVMMAMYYFSIKEPEQYLNRIEQKHIRKLLHYA